MFDAIEDAGFSYVNNMHGRGTLRNIKEEANNKQLSEVLSEYIKRVKVRIVLTAHPIGYSDRIVPTGEFGSNTIGVVESTNEKVIAPFPIYKSEKPLSFSEQFDLNAGQNFGLSLSIPILNNLSNRTNVDRTKVNILRSINSLEQKKLDLENTVNQSYNDAKGAYKAYVASQKLVKARNSAFEYAQSKFEVGAMNSFDSLRHMMNLHYLI